LQMPVILGGAALTRRYVEEDLRRLYKGELYYGADAFAGLHIMDKLCAPERRRAAGSVGLAALKPTRHETRDARRETREASVSPVSPPGCRVPCPVSRVSDPLPP